MCGLLQLPSELMIALCDKIHDPRVLARLARVSKRLREVALSVLRRRLKEAHCCIPLLRAVNRRDLFLTERLLQHGCSPNVDRGQSHPRWAQIYLNPNNPYASPHVPDSAFDKEAVARRHKKMNDLIPSDHDQKSAVKISKWRPWANGNALQIACDMAHKDMIDLLLDYGADPNITSGPRGFPLHVAAKSGDVRLATALLDAGADVNYHHAPTFGRALDVATESGHTDLALLLLERGANDSLFYSKDETDSSGPGYAFRAAVDRSRDELVEALFARIKIPSQAAINDFHHCVQRMEMALTLRFMQNGIDPGGDGIRALRNAAEVGHVILLKILVEAGVDLNFPDDEGRTPLFRASRGGHAACVRYLFDHGASLKGTGRIPDWFRGGLEGWEVSCNTPLQAACHYGSRCDPSSPRAAAYEDVVRMLLIAGADPNESNGRFFHPLNLAVHFGRSISIVRLLLENGADASTRGAEYGDNALQAAVYSGNPEFVNLLLDHGAKIEGSGALQTACGSSGEDFSANLEILQLLLARGADVNDRSSAAAMNAFVELLGPSTCTVTYTSLKVVRTRQESLKPILDNPSRLQEFQCYESIAKFLLERGAFE